MIKLREACVRRFKREHRLWMALAKSMKSCTFKPRHMHLELGERSLQLCLETVWRLFFRSLRLCSSWPSWIPCLCPWIFEQWLPYQTGSPATVALLWQFQSNTGCSRKCLSPIYRPDLPFSSSLLDSDRSLSFQTHNTDTSRHNKTVRNEERAINFSGTCSFFGAAKETSWPSRAPGHHNNAAPNAAKTRRRRQAARAMVPRLKKIKDTEDLKCSQTVKQIEWWWLEIHAPNSTSTYKHGFYTVKGCQTGCFTLCIWISISSR